MTFERGSSLEIRFMSNGHVVAEACSFFGLVRESGAIMTMLEGFFLVLDDRSIELVDQAVDRRVHVLVRALAMDVLAPDVYARLDLLVQFLHREYHVHVDDVIEMVRDALELARNVVADRRGDFDVMPGQMQIHPRPLRLKIGRASCRERVSSRRVAGALRR